MTTAATVLCDYSEAEVKERAARAQAIMKSKGWEQLLVIDEGTAGVRYLAGLSHVKPPSPAFMVLPQSGDPVLLAAWGMAGAGINQLEKHTYVKVKPITGRGFGGDVPGAIAEALSDAGYKGGPLAVDGLPLLRDGLVTALKSKFPDISFVNAARTTEVIRLEKSAAEEANYRRSAIQSYNGMEVFMSVIRPGVRNDDAVQEATHVSVMQGAEENLLIHGAGTPWVWGRGTRGDNTFADGDLVTVELNARFHGYYAQVCRSWIIGHVDPEKQKLIDDTKRVTDVMYQVAKPGMTGKEIFRAAEAEAKKVGREFCDVRWGHGVGLTIGECFDFADWDREEGGPCTTPIPVGAHGNFHPFFIIPGPTGRGAYNALWGDPWIMGKDGVELLVDPPRALVP